MGNKIRLVVLLLVIVFCSLTLSAWAQNSTKGAEFTAQDIQYSYKKNVTTFWGSPEKPVSVQVGQLTIWAPHLEYYQETGLVVASGGVRLEGTDPVMTLTCQQIEATEKQVIATGDVTFDYQDFTGTAARLTYLPPKEWVSLEGDPVIQTGNGRISGERIEIDLVKEVVTATGGSKLYLEEVVENQ